MKTLLHFLGWQLGWSEPETQTTEREQLCLAKYAKGRKRLVELGVWHGVNTLRLRSVCDPNGILFAVDPFYAGRLGMSFQKKIAHRNVSKISNAEVRWVRMKGCEAAEFYRNLELEPVEFIFIDADHSYNGIKEDWESWKDLIGAGGHVALHDSVSSTSRNIESAGSVQYTREVISKDTGFNLVEVVDTLSVFQKK